MYTVRQSKQCKWAQILEEMKGVSSTRNFAVGKELDKISGVNKVSFIFACINVVATGGG